jgi:3-methyladenine DNA glycosylase/8-oxoguanine DNA glycosylase
MEDAGWWEDLVLLTGGSRVVQYYTNRPERTCTMTTTQEPFQNVIAMATTYLSDIDPIMRAAIERVGPCTLVPSSNVFEALIDAIISQQKSVDSDVALYG